MLTVLALAAVGYFLLSRSGDSAPSIGPEGPVLLTLDNGMQVLTPAGVEKLRGILKDASLEFAAPPNDTTVTLRIVAGSPSGVNALSAIDAAPANKTDVGVSLSTLFAVAGQTEKFMVLSAPSARQSIYKSGSMYVLVSKG